MEKADAYARGRAAWPDIAVDPAVFAAHVAHLDLPSEPHADLYLACACAHDDPGALATFDRELLGAVGKHIRRIDGSRELADEVRQLVRERLLVARDGERPRIAAYAGRGPLAAWVRVTAVRVALDVQRKRGGDPAAGGSASQLAAGELDPEAALIRARYQRDYEAALREALGELTAKQRNLLRMHFVDGMTVERIGTAYRVHRATAARWIVELRRQLLDAIYHRLGAQLALGPSEFASLTAVVRSQLHVSLGGLLGAPP
ncbi:MAG TPA: sigma-70 family RNA polymerase sigma factor [Kofleriaceae bacterium]|nr:sigma-70 family RNA polymerase sigma factor [Kofleriaceae bacterium]